MTKIEEDSKITNIIERCVQKKLRNFDTKLTYMPFHSSLVDCDKFLSYKFIHSLFTSIGMKVYKEVALEFAKRKFDTCHTKYFNKKNAVIGKIVKDEVQNVIDKILLGEKSPNKTKEIQQIKRAIGKKSKKAKIALKPTSLIVGNQDGVHLFHFAPADPNITDFEKYKEILLNWVATKLTENIELDIRTYVAVPYNPFFPEDYNVSKASKVLDIENELMIGQEFWDFIGGIGTYVELVQCFKHVGNKYMSRIEKLISDTKIPGILP